MADPTKSELITLARATSAKHQLDPDVVCGVCEQESGWNVWAVRYEPAFLVRYVQPLKLLQTESVARSISWGLMQVLGQVAREQGFKGEFLSQLCDPEIGIEYGCLVLASKLAMHEGNLEAGLLSYNGGSAPDYGKQVLAKANYYRNSQPQQTA